MFSKGFYNVFGYGFFFLYSLKIQIYTSFFQWLHFENTFAFNFLIKFDWKWFFLFLRLQFFDIELQQTSKSISLALQKTNFQKNITNFPKLVFFYLLKFRCSVKCKCKTNFNFFVCWKWIQGPKSNKKKLNFDNFIYNVHAICFLDYFVTWICSR